MSPTDTVCGTVDIRDETDVAGLIVELWDPTARIPAVELPYRALAEAPSVLRRRLGDTPAASTRTDDDGGFDVAVCDGAAKRYVVRVFDERTFLGSVEVRNDDGGGTASRGSEPADQSDGRRGQGNVHGGDAGGPGQGAGQARDGRGGGQQPQGGPPGGPPGGGGPGGGGAPDGDDGGILVSVPGKAAGAAGGLGLAGLATWYLAFRDDGDDGGGDGDATSDGDDTTDDVLNPTGGTDDETGGDTGGETDDDGDTGGGTGDGGGQTGEDGGGETGDGTDDGGGGGDDGGGDGTDDGGGGDDGQYSPIDASNNQPQSGEERPSFSPDVEQQANRVYRGDGGQEGVDPAQTREDRLSVVRGEVVDRDGNPVSGVRVSFKVAREFGQYRTDDDGSYDLAVNGGRFYTLVFRKEGYIPVQRRRRVAAKDHELVEPVVLVESDAAQSTQVTMDADEAQAVVGAESSDADGTRSSLLVVPPGTTGGYEDELTFRSLEYTVGESGQAAMPAELPSRSGYTYAVEYNATGSDVQRPFMRTSEREFNRPVIHYNENFLGFPVGSTVPTGLYDRQGAAWEPSDDGRVVEITDTSGGTATLDVEGNGQAASQSDLDDLGVADGELEQLAAQFDSGTELWRTPVPHFTPVDCNWSVDPPWDDDEEDPLCTLIGWCDEADAGEDC